MNAYSESKDIKHDFGTAFWFFIIIVIVMVGAGFVLTTGGGIKDPAFKERFLLYSVLGGLGFAFIFGIDLFNYISGTRALKTIVHEPEESVVGSARIFRNPLLLFLFSVIVFLPITLIFASVSNTFFSQTPFYSQSFLTSAVSGVGSFFASLTSTFSDAIFPALAENLFAFVLLSLAYTFVYKKFYRSHREVHYLFTLLVFPIVFGLMWMFFHASAYGTNDVALRSTLFFGLLGVFFTMLTMSFIVWAVFHFLTNFMIVLRNYGFLANEGWVVGLIFVWVLFIILFVLALRFDKSKSKGGAYG
jgi:hypothetical protein